MSPELAAKVQAALRGATDTQLTHALARCREENKLRAAQWVIKEMGRRCAAEFLQTERKQS